MDFVHLARMRSFTPTAHLWGCTGVLTAAKQWHRGIGAAVASPHAISNAYALDFHDDSPDLAYSTVCGGSRLMQATFDSMHYQPTRRPPVILQLCRYCAPRNGAIYYVAQMLACFL